VSDWVPEPGDRVAVLYSAATVERVEFTTVEKVLKRDVVLANGDRFSKPHLTKRSPGAWSGGYTLLPPDHERVVRAQARIADERRRFRIRTLCDQISAEANYAKSEWSLRALDLTKDLLVVVTGAVDAS
jgi:hypothetical protein